MGAHRRAQPAPLHRSLYLPRWSPTGPSSNLRSWRRGPRWGGDRRAPACSRTHRVGSLPLLATRRTPHPPPGRGKPAGPRRTQRRRRRPSLGSPLPRRASSLSSQAVGVTRPLMVSVRSSSCSLHGSLVRRRKKGGDFRPATNEQIISPVSSGCISQSAHLHNCSSIPCSRVCNPRPHLLWPLRATPTADLGERSFQDVE